MHKKFKFCIDTRHFECTIYWFGNKYVIKIEIDINPNINVSHVAIHLMGIPTIGKDYFRDER